MITKEKNKDLNNYIETLISFEYKVLAFVKAVKERISYPQEYMRLIIESAYKRILLARTYKPNFKLKSELVLLKGIEDPSTKSLPNDYNLSKYTKKIVKIINIDSNHITIPFNVNIPAIINGMLENDLLMKYKNTNRCLSYMMNK